MTARELFALPEPAGGFVWELHFGELVKRRLPRMGEYRVKMRVSDLLKRKLGRQWLVGIALPYGLVPNDDFRAADVGAVPLTRWDASQAADVMIGTPDIVVQVGREVDAVLHITHGASAVWLVKPEQREVVVITATSRQVYRPGQAIPLPGSASLDVADIFPA
jgi:hypothetical protein